MATKTPVIDLQPSRLDLKLYAGDGAAIKINLSDGTAPMPLSGEVIAQVRESRLDTDARVNFTVDSSGFADGYVMISLSGDDTRLLNTEGEVQVSTFDGVWDVQWTPDGGSPTTLLQGEVTCTLDVTR